MKPLLPFVILSLAFAAPIALAGDYDDLLNDLEIFEEFMANEIADQEQQDRESALESQEDLFPLEEGDEAELPDLYVSVMVDGQSITLRDVLRSEWYGTYVADVAEQGIVSGYRNQSGYPTGMFGPGDNVNIEQLAKMVVEAASINLIYCATGLPQNVSAFGRWSASYISCAEARNWITFSKDTDVTRLATRREVVVAVLQAFGIQFEGADPPPFGDVMASSLPHAGAIGVAYRDNIVSGYKDKWGDYTGKFGPEDPVTRAEVAKIISLAIQTYSK